MVDGRDISGSKHRLQCKTRTLTLNIKNTLLQQNSNTNHRSNLLNYLVPLSSSPMSYAKAFEPTKDPDILYQIDDEAILSSQNNGKINKIYAFISYKNPTGFVIDLNELQRRLDEDTTILLISELMKNYILCRFCCQIIISFAMQKMI